MGGNGDRKENSGEVKFDLAALRRQVESGFTREAKVTDDHEMRIRSLEAERVEDNEARLRAVETGVEKLRERLGLWAAVQATLTTVGTVLASAISFIRGGN